MNMLPKWDEESITCTDMIKYYRVCTDSHNINSRKLITDEPIYITDEPIYITDEPI